MYQSPDEARSDLFLAGAVYLFGPSILAIVLDIFGIRLQQDTVGTVIRLAVRVASTVLVPFLLIRYRQERLGMYGLGGGPSASIGMGLLVAAPIVAATVISGLLGPTPGRPTIPVLTIGPGALLQVVVRLIYWLCLVLLAVYGTVKARDAFRGEPRSVREGVMELGRWVGIVAAVATALLLVAGLNVAARFRLDLLLLLPLGVAGAVLLTLRTLRGPSVTTRATLLTPTVLLAISAFTFSFNALDIVTGAWLGALAGGVGLIVGALQEQRRSAQGPLTLAVALALLTNFGAP